jgi:NAD(P)-dependent dehydrogenase (short-subunit alcohol dehydrogenase family)
MSPLTGRIALVTGGARGIGRAIATRLAAEGAIVTIADIAPGPPLAGIEAATVDIGRDDSVAALAQWLAARHGRLDILINNAAILDATPSKDLTFARYRHVLDINLDGAVRMIFALLPLLRADGGSGRRIVNIASIMGLRGSRDSLSYSTAKGGIVNLTRSLACDLGPEGILVNAVAPGFIDTQMALLPDGSGHEHDTDWFRDVYLKYGKILLGRAGNPEDVAGPVAFLCSEDARYMTGQVLLVDGGVSATF